MAKATPAMVPSFINHTIAEIIALDFTNLISIHNLENTIVETASPSLLLVYIVSI